MVGNRGRVVRRRGSLVSFRGMMTFCAFLLGTLSLSVSISHFMCSLWSTSHGFRGAALSPSILEDYNPKDYAVADLSKVGFIKDRNQTQKIVDESNWKTRVYCMVPTLYAPHQINLMTAIANGWGAYCDEIKFFVDPPTDGKEIPKWLVDPTSGRKVEIVVLPMVRKANTCGEGKTCRHIWEKVWRAWDYVARNDINKAEWFLKVDDDSYFIPSNLRKFIRERGWSPDDPHYFGHKVYVTEDLSIASGICSTFSRKAIIELGKRLSQMQHQYGHRSGFSTHGKCIDRDGATEEKVTATCLAEAGIVVEEVIDSQNREYVLPLGIPFTVMYKRKPSTTSWYWSHKPVDRGDESNCCSPHAWGMHGYKSSTRMRRMTDLLINYQLNDVKKRFKNEKEDSEEWWHLWYILKLREGMAADPYFRYWRKKPSDYHDDVDVA